MIDVVFLVYIKNQSIEYIQNDFDGISNENLSVLDVLTMAFFTCRTKGAILGKNGNTLLTCSNKAKLKSKQDILSII